MEFYRADKNGITTKLNTAFYIYMRFILLNWIWVIDTQTSAYLGGWKGGCLLEGWVLIRRGAYLIILCLG